MQPLLNYLKRIYFEKKDHLHLIVNSHSSFLQAGAHHDALHSVPEEGHLSISCSAQSDITQLDIFLKSPAEFTLKEKKKIKNFSCFQFVTF